MKISNGQINEALRIYKQQAVKNARSAAKTEEAKASAMKDKVEISAQGQEIMRVKKVLEQVPEVREELVKELRAKIDSGTYNVSGREIAAKMLGRGIVDKLV